MQYYSERSGYGYPLTRVLIFPINQESNNYRKFKTEIETFVSTPSFKLKSRINRNIKYEANGNRRSIKQKNTSNSNLGSAANKSKVYDWEFAT